MGRLEKLNIVISAFLVVLGLAAAPPVSAQEKKPNILVIMGDDVGWFNIGAYDRGIMSGKTPNLDKLADLDGYNQMAMLTGTGPSARHELFYFAGPHLGAIRIDDFKYQFIQQPYGWPGEKVTTDMPSVINIRQDPFERTSMLRGETTNTGAFGYGNEFFAREFWRFVVVHQTVTKLAMTAMDCPPMQDQLPSIWMPSKRKSRK
jgi:hypothetical protein